MQQAQGISELTGERAVKVKEPSPRCPSSQGKAAGEGQGAAMHGRLAPPWWSSLTMIGRRDVGGDGLGPGHPPRSTAEAAGCGVEEGDHGEGAQR